MSNIPRSEHLLPPNATPAEQSVATITRRVDDIPAPIDVMHRPAETPAAFLPWLAWEWSLDIWNAGWSDERKRSVVAKSFDLHRLKGTAAGLRAHVDLVDAKVKQIVRPPQGVFASRTLTKEEMDAWLRTMPQIRVYLAREQGSGAGSSFAGDDFVDDAFAGFDAGRALYGRAARLWDNGVETHLKIVDLTTEQEERAAIRVERVSIPGRAGESTAFVGGFVDHMFADAVVDEARLVTYRQDVTYEHRASTLSMRSAHPGLQPVDVRSERISDRGDAGPFAFAGKHGSFVGDCFAGTDRAAWMMYDRIVLHDPARAAPKVDGWSFADHSSLGIPDYTAKAVIDLQETMPEESAAVGRFVDHCFAVPEDSRKRDAACSAVQASKALRDRVLVTHQLTRPREFSDTYPLDGSFAFGGLVPFRL